MRPLIALLLLPALALLPALSGCEQLGIDSAATVKARVDADGKAIGGACRHAGRAIEDCYTLNKKAERAAVYAGWREMSEYMTENKLEPVLPVITPEPPKLSKAAKLAASAAEDGDEPAEQQTTSAKH